MSNTQRAKLGGAVVPAGDMGLGLCLQCLGEIIAQGDGAPTPRFGVTLAPMPQQIMGPQGPATVFVAVPACWEHLRQASQPAASARRPLLVATGGV